MKFSTQHKRKAGVDRNRPKDIYGLHRNSNKVWITSGESGVVISSHEFPTVRQAKNWMQHPNLTYSNT